MVFKHSVLAQYATYFLIARDKHLLIPDGRVYSYFLEWHSSYLLYNTMSSEGWWKFGKIDYFLQAVAATCGNNAFSATLKKDRDIEVQVQEEKIFREDFLRKSVTMAEKSSAIIP